MQYPTIAQPQYGFAPTMPMMPSMSDMPPAMMAKGGLASAAQNVQSQGRNGDSMLVHMTPREVGGLQALAMQHGGSLTINPQTGLPEANFLESILPTLLGIGGTFLGIPPHLTALAVGGIQTARTGDLGKGLMAGLGAYGGANLAGSLGAAGAQQGVQAAGAAGADLTAQTGTLAADNARDALLARSAETLPASVQALPTATTPTFASNAAQAGQGFKNLFASGPTGEGARAVMLENAGGYTGLAKQAGMAAAPALLAQPEPYTPTEEESNYEGPYTPTPRQVRFPTEDQQRDLNTAEFQYFDVVNPFPGFLSASERQAAQTTLPSTSSTLLSLAPGQTEEDRLRGIAALSPRPFMAAKGGSVPMLENGGFVLTKKAVDGLGKGSNKKGQRVASRGLGAIPIKGPGTGTSDSIKTSIDGKRPALVSNGEAYVPKKQVAKKGGAKTFYALMKKAEKAAEKRKA